MNTDDQTQPSDDFLPTRQSLLSRLKNWDDQASWQEFFATYWKLIYATARKAGLSDAESQDVVQETVIAVCKQMPDFKYDPKLGSFKGWLLQQTSWRIKDQLRKRLPNQAGDPNQPTTELEGVISDQPVGDLEATWEAEWQSNLLEAAIERVKRKVNAKHFQLFDLYVLHKWPIARICAFLNVNRSQIYLAKFRVARLLKQEMDHLQHKWQ